MKLQGHEPKLFIKTYKITCMNFFKEIIKLLTEISLLYLKNI